MKRIKVSDLIKSLKYMQDTYGDLPVNISIATDTNFGKPSEKEIITCEEFWVNYEQHTKPERHDEIGILNFPY
jgi:hypothetical protein